MNLTTFRTLVDDPNVKDIFLLPALGKLMSAGPTVTTDGMEYLKEKRPDLFSQVNTLFNILNVSWPKDPAPVDHGVQGPG